MTDGMTALTVEDIAAPRPWGPIPVPPPGHTWETLMDRAISVAAIHLSSAEHAEIPVGAVGVPQCLSFPFSFHILAHPRVLLPSFSYDCLGILYTSFLLLCL